MYVCVCVYIYIYIYMRRKWQPTQVILPRKSHGQRSLAGYNPWSCKRIRHTLVTKPSPCIYILFFLEQWECCTKLTQLLFHVLVCVWPTVPSAYWWVRRNWKKKKLSCLLSSFLLVIIFSVSSWLTHGSSMNNVFLRMSFPSFCFQRNFWLEQKMQLLGAVGTPAYLVTDAAHLLCATSESHWMPKHSRSTWIPCSWAVCALHANGAAKSQTYTVHISSGLMHAPLSQDISLRKQLLKS